MRWSVMFALAALAGGSATPVQAQPGPFAGQGSCYTVCGPNGRYQVCPSQAGCPVCQQMMQQGAPPSLGDQDGPYLEARFGRARFVQRFRGPLYASPRFGFGAGVYGGYGPYTPGVCPGGCPDCPRVRVNQFSFR